MRLDTVGVIIPVLNDAAPLADLIADLRTQASLEIVVVDGGSDDGGLCVAERLADTACSASPGRGRQLRIGVAQTRREWLWFLHADSRVSTTVLQTLAMLPDDPSWGWFDVRLDGSAWPLRVVENAMNFRAAATGIATGDQGLFAHRRLLAGVGGVPPLKLMEDIELCKRLRRLQRGRRCTVRIVTSSRRWQRDGIVRTVFSMWWFRLRYFLGADADALAARYYRHQ